jgi:hypothetical protein
MVYHPYLRGKQYELITVRETASVLAAAKFKPIIEPVRESLGGLQKALDAVVDAEGSAVLIVNPHHGDLSDAGDELTKLLQKKYLDLPNIAAGILLKHSTTLAEAIECFGAHQEHTPVFIHAGFADAKGLAMQLGDLTKDDCHVFFEELCGKLYRRHFEGAHRVLLRDGFARKKNADYSPVESFSDLHITYPEEGMDSFGDFLIVGDDFTEGGGPAYAVAIHLTFIDPDQDDAMQVYHFVSDRQNTPKDPAGKFAEALAKLVACVDAPDSRVFETEAVKEFRKLHAAGHFPGLGYVKKLSMNHHIETLADYFASE